MGQVITRESVLEALEGTSPSSCLGAHRVGQLITGEHYATPRGEINAERVETICEQVTLDDPPKVGYEMRRYAMYRHTEFPVLRCWYQIID